VHRIATGVRHIVSVAAVSLVLCLSATTYCRADGPFVPAPRVPPPGVVVNPDGSYAMADGTFVAANGTVYYPDGTIVYPDGTVTGP